MRIGIIAAVAGAIAAGTAVAAVLFLYAPPSLLQPSMANPSASSATNGTNASEQVAARAVSTSPTAGYPKVDVTVSNYTLMADIADTPQRMQTGLDVRDSMNDSQGMLFPFTDEGNQGFWMKGMKFPIDIIWINKDRKVVHIEPSLAPCTPLSCPVYTPSEPAMYVLETTSGFAQRHNVNVGTYVNFDLSREFK